MRNSTLKNIYSYLNRNREEQIVPPGYKSRDEWKKQLGVKDTQFDRIRRALQQEKSIESKRVMSFDQDTGRCITKTYYKISDLVLKGRNKRR
jgi:hypothetical protein